MHRLRTQSFYFIFVLLLVALAVEILVFAPESVNLPRRENIQESADSAGHPPEQTMVGAQLFYTKDGVKEWELRSDKASGSFDHGNLTLEHVRAQVFGRDKASYTVTGDRGTILANRKDLEIMGHVVTHSSNGYIFKTEHMTYQSESRTLHGPGAVHMYSDNTKLNVNSLDVTGTEIFADLNSDHIKISHNVHARKGVSETQTVKIRSQSALFSGRDFSASFMGEVLVEMGDARITGPRARFVIDPQSDQLKSLVVNGGIRLSDMERWATAEQIDMLFREDRYILSGSPRVVQNSDELFGDQIIYSKGGKDIYVNDVKARFEDDPKEKLIK